ncbi:MAG: carboxymuconolactone decarboxylase family protein [Planctomycetaceae bacterium]|nr:carboxymuconolactone decarboxylase family protein [Planctomycetaceae bacterium]
MSLVPPLSPADAPEKVQQTYGRIQEMLGTSEVPAVFFSMGRVEPFLRDAYMNLKRFVFGDGAIDAKTRAAIALAVACHAKSKPWIDVFAERCRATGWTETQVHEIVAVASTNYMYNTFFKFRDLSGSALFEGMGVGLRAHTFGSTSLDEKTVELLNTAVSDINACKPCTSGHVESARQMGVRDEQLLETIQCAATVYAVAQFTSVAE